MSIAGIKNAIVKVAKSKPAGVVSRAIGAVSIASVVYDSHVNAKEDAICKDQLKSANRFFDEYDNYMLSHKESATVAKLKSWWFDAQQSFSSFHLANRASGYVGGFCKTVGTNLPTLALGATSLFTKNVGKVASVLLILGGIKTFVYDVVGIGKKNNDNL